MHYHLASLDSDTAADDAVARPIGDGALVDEIDATYPSRAYVGSIDEPDEAAPGHEELNAMILAALVNP